MKPDFADKAAQLYRDQFPRPDNYVNAYSTIADIAKALEDAYEAGRKSHRCGVCNSTGHDSMECPE